MTFGVVAWNETETFETAINRADALLYFGKEHGRNQIVVQK
jgi:PleD family two-component response regulator